MCSVEAYSVCPDEGLDAVGDRQCHIACYGAGTANWVGHNQVHRVPAVVPNNVLLRGWRGVDVERRSGCCGEAQHGVHRLIVCCCGCRAIYVGKCLVGRGDADRLILQQIGNDDRVRSCTSRPKCPIGHPRPTVGGGGWLSMYCS